MKRLFTLLSLLLTLAVCHIQALAQPVWTSVDDTTRTERERITQTDYEVSLCTRGRTWKPLEVRGALVSNIVRRTSNETDSLGAERTLMGFCMFTDDFRRPVKVRVRRRGAPFGMVQIRPTDARIPYKRIDGQTIEFTLRSARQRVSVEYDGDRNHNLFLIPDLPCQQPSDSSRVIYYGPGEHEVGNIDLQSGQTLYLAEGAIVYATLTAHHASDIAVRGRGILCGSRAAHDFSRRPCLVNFQSCRRVTLEGVMFRGSPSWTLNLGNCDSVLIDNVKQICWMRNSDGIDLCNVRHARIRNCFLRNYDDNISLKNYNVGVPDAHLYDIRMEDCLLWADAAHNLLVGPESRPDLEMSDIAFSRIHILEGRETAYPWVGALAVMISDEGAFRDVVFQDIVLDDIRGGRLFSVDYCRYNTKGRQASNIQLKNIRYTGMTPPESMIWGLDTDHQVEGITLQNVQVNGIRLTPTNLSEYVSVNPFVRGLVVE